MDGPPSDLMSAPTFDEDQAQQFLRSDFPGTAITSGYRSPEHNADVGGVPDSMHTTGQAVDFVPPHSVSADTVRSRALASGYPVTEFLNEGDHLHWGWRPKNSPPQQSTSSEAPPDGLGVPSDLVSPPHDLISEPSHVPASTTTQPSWFDRANADLAQKFGNVGTAAWADLAGTWDELKREVTRPVQAVDVLVPGYRTVRSIYDAASLPFAPIQGAAKQLAIENGWSPAAADIMTNIAMLGRGVPDIMAARVAEGPPPDLVGSQDSGAPPGPVGPAAHATPPSEAPSPNSVVGMRFPSGPPRRAIVDHYFDDGHAVRLRFDDGELRDHLTSTLLNNITEPPAPLHEPAEPNSTGEPLTHAEAMRPFDEDFGSPKTSRRSSAPPQMPLGGEAMHALDQAARLERAALAPNTGQFAPSVDQREAWMRQAAELRGRYGVGASTEAPRTVHARAPAAPDLGPLGRAGDARGQQPDYQHPYGEATRLGELGVAAARNPENYTGGTGPIARPPGPAQADVRQAMTDLAHYRQMKANPPTDLEGQLRALGGIRTSNSDGTPTQGAPDIINILGGRGQALRLLNNKTGRTPDMLRQALAERGWFGGNPSEDVHITDIGDLIDLIDRHRNVRPVYHPDDPDAHEWEARGEFEREMSQAGITRRDALALAGRKLAAWRASHADQWESGEESAIDARLAPTEREEANGYEPGTDIGAELEALGRPGEAGAEAGAEADQAARAEGAGALAAQNREPQARSPEETLEREAQFRRDWGLDEPGGQYTTEPGAVDANGKPLQQMIIPGAERSAKQLAAAREAQGKGRLAVKGPQQDAGPLFGETAAGQRSLLDNGGYRRLREGTQADLMDNFRARYPEVEALPPEEKNKLAELYVLGRGKATGHETLATYDANNNRVAHVITSSNPRAVFFDESDPLVHALAVPTNRLVLHHNHPSNSVLSSNDIAQMSKPGLAWMIAHGHDGKWSAARLNPDWLAQAGDNSDLEATLSNRIKAIRGQLQRAIQQRIYDGALSTADEPDLSAALSHYTSLSLARDGIIDYMHNWQVPERIAREYEIQTGRLYRSAEPVGASEGTQRVLADLGISGRQSGEAADDGRTSTLSPGPAQGGTYRRPQQLRLIENEREYEQPPRTISEGREFIDETAQSIAKSVGGKPPGTLSRLIDRLGPKSRGDVYLDANQLQRLVMGPRTLAELDSPSARMWNAIKGRTAEYQGMLDDLRSHIGQNFLKLSKASQDKVLAVQELDRLNNYTRSDDGYPIVARNDKFPYARATAPGDVLKLDPKETQAYFGLRTMYDHAWDRLMEASARQLGWDDQWGSDAFGNLQAIRDAAQHANHPALAQQYARAADIVQAMIDQKQQGYMPLMRFGDYYISVKPKPGTDPESLGGFPAERWFELAERPPFHNVLGARAEAGAIPSYAEERLADLAQHFPASHFDIEHGYLSKKPAMLRDLDIPAVEKLMTLMEGGVLDKLKTEGMQAGLSKADARAQASQRYDDLYGNLVDTLRDQMYEQLKAGFKQRSYTVPGYSADFHRTLGSYMNWTSRHVADSLHRDNIEGAFGAIQQSHPFSSIKNYWKRWKQADESPASPLSHAANVANQAGFLYSLAMNPASTMSILLHGPTMGIPTLATGIGAGRAMAAFGKAFGEAVAAMRTDSAQGLHIDTDKLGRTPDEKAFLSRLKAEGELHARGADDLRSLGQRASRVWGEHADTVRRASDIASSNIAAVDQANRIATAMSAYRLAKGGLLDKMDQTWSGNEVWRQMKMAQGKTPENMAHFMLSQGVGEWGPESHSEAGRTVAGRMAASLHGFHVRLLSNVMKQTVRQGPAGKVALGFTLAALWAGAGLEGLPFVQDAENATDKVYKTITGRDPMLSYRLRQFIADSGFGKIGAETILRGPLSELTGTDFASRLGFGDLISRELGDNGTTLTVPSIVWNAGRGIAEGAGSGHPVSGLAHALPAALRNPAMAAVEAREGVKSQTGKTTYLTPQQVTGADEIRRSLGLRSLDEMRARELQEYRYRARRAHMRAPADVIPAP